MRRSMPLVLTATLALFVAAPAVADPPGRDLPPFDVQDSLELPAGEVCDFPVLIELSGKAGFLYFEDRNHLLAPGAQATLTNIDTGTTITRNDAGPGDFMIDVADDGSATLTIHQFGNWLHVHPGELYTMHGYVIFEGTLGPDGQLLSFEEDESRAHREDLCSVLAG
jgi:hypothetical protein